MLSRHLHRTLSLLALVMLLLFMLVGVAASAQTTPATSSAPGSTEGPKDIRAMANVFTPNGDGINDRFVPRKDLLSYTLQVYDRWGNLVHTGTQDTPWDGNGPQGNQPEGVYVYRLEGRTDTGDSLRHVGTITLLR
jgi:gliding motility-associated-like protein